MLLNTVIIALSDALPIFILCVLLLLFWQNYLAATAQAETFNRPAIKVAGTVCCGLMGAVFYVQQSARMSEWFDFNGLEWMTIILRSLLYATCVLSMITFNWPIRRRFNVLMLGLCTALILNGSDFLIYILGYWSQSDNTNALIVGATLGLGVCLSFSILYYFLLYQLSLRIPWLITLLLTLYLVGQIIPVVNVLVQIDYIPAQQALWNINNVIDESSEVGRLMRALFGYEATPMLWELMLFLFLTGVPMASYFYQSSQTRLKVKEAL